MIPFESRIPTQDRHNYTIDAISGAYYGFFIGFCAPFIPVILKRMDASPFQIGLSLAAPFLSLVLGFPLYRYLSGYRALDIVAVPTIFSRLLVAFIGLCSTPETILGFYVISQFVESLGLAAYTRVLKDLYSPVGRGPAMGSVRFFLAVTMVAGSALGGKLLDSGHPALPFLLAGICGSISSISFLRVFPRNHSPRFCPKQIHAEDIFRTLRVSEGFLWLNVTVLLFGFGNLLVFGSLPTMLVDRFHISNSALGYLNGLTNIFQMGSYLFIGRALTRIGGTRGLLFGMLAGLCTPWIFMWASRIEALGVPFALTGIMNASFDLCWPILVLAFAPEAEIGTFASVYALHMGVRGLVAMFVSNLALPLLGPNFFFAVGGILMLTGVTVGYGILEKWEQPVLTQPA